MKKEYSYLIASIALLIGAMAFFLSDKEHKAALGSALTAIGIAFMAIFINRIQKQK